MAEAQESIIVTVKVAIEAGPPMIRAVTLKG